MQLHPCLRALAVVKIVGPVQKTHPYLLIKQGHFGTISDSFPIACNLAFSATAWYIYKPLYVQGRCNRDAVSLVESRQNHAATNTGKTRGR